MTKQRPVLTLAERPFLTLFALSGAVAILCALADVIKLAVYFGLGRLHQIQALSVLWRHIAAPYVDLLEYAPTIFKIPFDLTNGGSFFLFLSLAMLTGLATTWMLACVTLPFVAIGRAVFPCRADRPTSSWFWRKAYPLAIVVVAFLPEPIGAAHRVASGAALIGLSPLDAFILWWLLVLLYVGIVWWLLLRMLKQPSQVAGFSRVVVGGGITAFLLAGVIAAGTAVFGSDPDKGSQPLAAAGRPNVLLVSIDSLRSDHLHCYGYPRETSPTIDRLAAQGTRFETAVAPSSWTLPSHVTMLSSLPPLRHGVVDDGLRFGEDTVTLPEVLWQEGYNTAGFVSGPYLDASYGFSQGFDTYDDYSVVKPSFLLSVRGATSPKLVDAVAEWLGRWNTGGQRRPFFLFVHMWDVHYDYTPPPPYDTMFDPDYDGKVTGENVEIGSEIHKDMTPRDLQHLIALYDGEIRYTDTYLGRILDLLVRLEVLDDTIVVLTADHGEEFFEHGRKTHHKSLYDESILVPLIVRFPPKVPAGRVVRQQARLMDIPPTILSLAGIDLPPEFGMASEVTAHGERDLSSLMTGGSASSVVSPPAFLSVRPREVSPSKASDPVRTGDLYAIRTERYKLLRVVSRSPHEVFDLIADPGERVNLLDQESDTIKRLSLELETWREHWSSRSDVSERIRLTRDQEEKLRSLGYLE